MRRGPIKSCWQLWVCQSHTAEANQHFVGPFVDFFFIICFFFCFVLKKKHIANKGRFIVVHSRMYLTCLTKVSVQTVGVEDPSRCHCVLPGLPLHRATGGPGKPVMQEPGLQKDLSTEQHVGNAGIIHKIHQTCCKLLSSVRCYGLNDRRNMAQCHGCEQEIEMKTSRGPFPAKLHCDSTNISLQAVMQRR